MSKLIGDSHIIGWDKHEQALRVGDLVVLKDGYDDETLYYYMRPGPLVFEIIAVKEFLAINIHLEPVPEDELSGIIETWNPNTVELLASNFPEKKLLRNWREGEKKTIVFRCKE